MQPTRIERVTQQLQREIAQIIHQELKDPRLGFVTITKVELSKDLTHAKVSFSCLGTPEEQTRSQEALDHATGFIRGLLKKRFRLRVIPRLAFRYDDSIQDAITLSAALDQLKRSSPSPSRGPDARRDAAGQ